MASEKRIYFTYAFLRQDGSPYYIGKGCGSRHLKKSGRSVPPPRDTTRILILKRNLTESEAFNHEKYMIFVYGRKNNNTGILHNRTDGGEGCSGTIYSEESRRVMSQKRKNRVTKQSTRDKLSLAMARREPASAETRQKLSRSLKGKEKSQEHCQALSEARKQNWLDPLYRQKVVESLRQRYKDNPLTDKDVQQRVEACKGKKWFWNPETGHTVRLNPDDLLPEGYTPGRKTFKRGKKHGKG